MKKNIANLAETNPKRLIVVESPAKARTLKKYLGKDYDVKASIGHVKDLPKRSLGVDIEKNFEPTYEIIKGKKKFIEEIKKASEKAVDIYLAPDPDREGEAIAWHIAELLGSKAKNKIHRVLFTEITKNAVLNALEKPTTLNQGRYESQQARRILDRLVGYKISPLLWIKVKRGLSAGRVQSVAVRIISEREKEIEAFVPRPYWEIEGNFESPNGSFKASLFKIGEEKLERFSIDNDQSANKIVNAIKSGSWFVDLVQKKERQSKPYPPFITSTLQQEASKRLHFSAKKTMALAQQLYEGVEIKGGGPQGLITYMRTDSTRLSENAVLSVRQFIEKNFGKQYVPNEFFEYKSKKKIQDAHEAIRPSDVENTPHVLKPYLEEDLLLLYELIWKRFVACQMSPMILEQTTIEIVSKSDISYFFRASGSVTKFEGFRLIWPLENDEKEELPTITKETIIKPVEINALRKETQPPPRYTESSLIKELEDKGIGRPSTYAMILSTIQDRNYVEKKDGKFYPTELGTIVTELLVENFSDIINVGFTASMEENLDQIEEGEKKWVNILKEFYEPFEKDLLTAKKKMRNLKTEETPTGLSCPKCGKDLVIKWGKNGKFIACQGYPDCKFTSEFTKNENGGLVLVERKLSDEKCPSCGAPMVLKTGRFGQFFACSSYPNCKTTKTVTTGIKCPQCQKGELVQRRSRFGKIFYSCTRYPECNYAIWDKPIKDKPCPKCNYPFMVEHYSKKEGLTIRCPNKACLYTEEPELKLLVNND